MCLMMAMGQMPALIPGTGGHYSSPYRRRSSPARRRRMRIPRTEEIVEVEQKVVPLARQSVDPVVPPLGQVRSASNPNQGAQVKAELDDSDHAVHWWKENWPMCFYTKEKKSALSQLRQRVEERYGTADQDTKAQVDLILKEVDKVGRLVEIVDKLLGKEYSVIETLPNALSLAIYNDEIVEMLDAVQGCTDSQALNSLPAKIKTQQKKCVEKLRNIVQCKMDWLKTQLINWVKWNGLNEAEEKIRSVAREAQELLNRFPVTGYISSIFQTSELDTIERVTLKSIAEFDYRRGYTSEEVRDIRSGVYVDKLQEPIIKTIQRTRNAIDECIKQVITKLSNMIITGVQNTGQETVPVKKVSYTARVLNMITVTSSPVKEKGTDQIQKEISQEDIEGKFLELSNALSEKTDFTEMLELLDNLADRWAIDQLSSCYEKYDAFVSKIYNYKIWYQEEGERLDWDKRAHKDIMKIRNNHRLYLDTKEAEVKRKQDEEKAKAATLVPPTLEVWQEAHN